MPWGCNQFGIIASLMTAQGGADVVVPSGTTTTVLSVGGNSTSLRQQSNDQYISVVNGNLQISLGAGAPTALAIGYFVQGVQQDQYNVDPVALVANAQLNLPIALLGPGSRALFNPPGSSIPEIKVTATTNGCTVRNSGSRAIFSLAIGGP